MKQVVIAALAASVAFLGAGCSGEETNGPTSDDVRIESGTASGSQGEAQDATGNYVKELGGSTQLFGKPVKYDDGLMIVVNEPVQFEPSSKTVTGARKHVRFTVRLSNGSRNRISPANVFITVESGGGQGGDVFDAEQAMSGPPTRVVKPGGRTSWVQGFGVVDPEDVIVIVQAGLDRAPVEFTGLATG